MSLTKCIKDILEFKSGDIYIYHSADEDYRARNISYWVYITIDGIKNSVGIDYTVFDTHFVTIEEYREIKLNELGI